MCCYSGNNTAFSRKGISRASGCKQISSSKFQACNGCDLVGRIRDVLVWLAAEVLLTPSTQWCYHMQVLFGVNQRLRVEDVDSPLVNIRPVKSVLLVIVTGDRGLCGGYNNFVLKKVGQHCCTRLPEHNHIQTAAMPPLVHHA